jgi:hypothetical protein
MSNDGIDPYGTMPRGVDVEEATRCPYCRTEHDRNRPPARQRFRARGYDILLTCSACARSWLIHGVQTIRTLDGGAIVYYEVITEPLPEFFNPAEYPHPGLPSRN